MRELLFAITANITWLGAVLLLIKVSCIVCFAWAVTAVLKQTAARLRHTVWMLTVFALLLLPALVVLLPGWQAVSLNDWSATESVSSLHDAEQLAREVPSFAPAHSQKVVDVAEPIVESSVYAKAESVRTFLQDGFTISQFLKGAWFIGFLILIGRLFYDLRRMGRGLENTVLLEAGALVQIKDDICHQLGIRREIALYTGAAIDMPMTWGLFKPVVALPQEACQWERSQQFAVLYHELSHVQRLDYIWHLLGQLVCALYWMNPLVWIAAYRLQFEQEQSCDEQVLQSGVDGKDYAEYLLVVARASRQKRLVLGGSMEMANEHALHKRVRSILNADAKPRSAERSFSTFQILCVGIVMAVVVLPLAAFQFEMQGENASYIWLEAEEGQLKGAMEISGDANASNGKYVWVAGDTVQTLSEQDEVVFGFDVKKAGEYIIWGRVIAPSGEANSFYVRMDEEEPDIWDAYGPDIEKSAKQWAWARVRSRTTEQHEGQDPIIYNLSAGRHHLSVKRRENGTRLDHLLITNDLNYRPRGSGGVKVDQAPAYIWLEAEDGDVLSPMEVAADETSSNGYFVGIPENSVIDPAGGSGETAFKFEVKEAGEYIIWGRVIAPSKNTNSFFVSVDGAEASIWDIDGLSANATGRGWAWDQVQARKTQNTSHQDPVVHYLAAGVHTLTLKGREKGTRLDRLLVTNDHAYKPEGWGASPEEVAPLYLWVEAEEGRLTYPFMVQQDRTASQGQFIAVSSEFKSLDRQPEEGRAIYHLTVPETGTYLMWSRVSASNDKSDSFWVRMDGGRWIKWNGIEQRNSWHWEEVHDTGRQYTLGVVSFELKPGRHTLEIAYREAEAKLDGFLFTNDLNYTPSFSLDEPAVLKREHLVSAFKAY